MDVMGLTIRDPISVTSQRFLLSETSRSAFTSICARGSCPWTKRSVRKVNHSFPPSVELENEWNWTTITWKSLPLCWNCFMSSGNYGWECSVKRDVSL